MDREFKRQELEYELRHEKNNDQSRPILKGYYFYNIPADANMNEVASLGIKPTKSGRYAMAIYDKSGYSTQYRKQIADSKFGEGKWWSPNKKTNENTGQTTPAQTLNGPATTGQITQVTDKDVTIDNKNGTKTVVSSDSGLLSKDATGKLTLNKTAVTNQQKPTVGQQVKLS